MFAHWKTWCGSVLSITQPEYVNFALQAISEYHNAARTVGLLLP